MTLILLILKLLGGYLLLGLACVPVLLWMARPKTPVPLTVIVEEEPEK